MQQRCGDPLSKETLTTARQYHPWPKLTRSKKSSLMKLVSLPIEGPAQRWLLGAIGEHLIRIDSEIVMMGLWSRCYFKCQGFHDEE